MTIPVLLILLLFTLGCLIFRRLKTGAGILLLAIVFVCGVGQGWLPMLLLGELQTEPALRVSSWQTKNAIVVLGMGALAASDGHPSRTNPFGYTRLYEAARQYMACKTSGSVCAIIPSGGDPAGIGTSEAAVMRAELEQIGVPATDILAEEKSGNTFQNAKFTSEILREQKFDHIVLVTSGVHLRRSLLYFSHFGVVEAVGAPSDRLTAKGSFRPSAQNFFVMDMALHEVVGILRYQVYNLFGLNSPPSSKN